MKKLLLCLAVAALSLGAGCNGNGSSESTEGGSTTTSESDIAPGLVEYDLSAHGLPLLIQVPDTSKAEPNIEYNNMGKLAVRIGKEFQIQIGEEPDMELKRMDLSEDLVFTSTMISEQPNFILYKSEVADADAGVAPRYHFYLVLEIDGVAYEISDIDEGEPFDEAPIEEMLRCAQTIKAVPVVVPS